MRYTRFLWLLPLLFLLSACSWNRTPEPSNINDTPPAVEENNSNTEENVSEPSPTTSEEDNQSKVFTYEDKDLGVKLQYPGSCYFNKGVFDCGDFTMSIWLLDAPSQALAQPIKTVKDNYTQIEYGVEDNGRHFALMAWYEGENKVATENTIAKIAQSVSFTK